jgi:hypothetical protein
MERKSRPKLKEPKAYRITLDNAARKELVPVKFIEPKEEKAAKEGEDADETPSESISEPHKDKDGRVIFKSPSYRFDPVKLETLNVIQDLVELNKADGSSTARKR